MAEIKLHFVMWPPNTFKNPNLAFMITTFNIVFPKEKKKHLL